MFDIVILAAGSSSRMQTDIPKALHKVAGKPMLEHVLTVAFELKPNNIHLIVSPQNQAQICTLIGAKDVNIVIQETPKGTGDAVATALPHIEPNKEVLVCYADMPLVRAPTMAKLLPSKDKSHCLSILTAQRHNPTGLGRIYRDKNAGLISIIEHRDANAMQLQIKEIYTGVCRARASDLKAWLSVSNTNNAQKEYYLTNIVESALSNYGADKVSCIQMDDPTESQGVNSRMELALAEKQMQLRLAQDLMNNGATVIDPERLIIRGKVTVGRDCIIDVGVIFEGDVQLGNGVHIGAYSILCDSKIADNAEIRPHSCITGSSIGQGAKVGPYARLREGTMLEENASVGNFIEIKNTRIGSKTKAQHFAYLGDTKIGNQANIGAGTVTCNYDGINKKPTYIGDQAFIGSNSTLVAELQIGDHAYIAAGSTITNSVNDNELGICRDKQRNIKDWNLRKQRSRKST